MPIALPLVGLDLLLVVLWVIAICLLIAVIMGYIAGVLHGLPTPLNQIAGPVANLAQGISDRCWSAVRTAESAVGAAWHALAHYIDKALTNFVAHSAVILQLAELVGSGLYSVSGLRSLVHSISYVAHAALSLADKLEKEFHGIEHRVRVIEREIGAGIGNDVRTSVDELVKWEKAAQAQLKADEKAITQTIPGELTQLENFIGAIPGTRYLDWAAGVVAAGLGLSIFNLFKCPTFLNKTLGRGCGLWNGLEDVFALLFDAVLFVDLCAVLPEAVTLFGEFEQPLTDLISGAANAACAQIPADWVVPTVAVGPLPPPQTLGDTLAA